MLKCKYTWVHIISTDCISHSASWPYVTPGDHEFSYPNETDTVWTETWFEKNLNILVWSRIQKKKNDPLKNHSNSHIFSCIGGFSTLWAYCWCSLGPLSPVRLKWSSGSEHTWSEGSSLSYDKIFLLVEVSFSKMTEGIHGAQGVNEWFGDYVNEINSCSTPPCWTTLGDFGQTC